MAKRKTKSKAIALTSGEKKPEAKPEFAYEITDKVFGDFKVKNATNAWWLNSGKLEMLINAFKYRATHVQACIAAGITEHQFRYFMEHHPDFPNIIELCRQVPGLKAKQTMVKALDHDLTTVRWFLEATEAGEYGKKPPVVAVQINMHDRVGKSRDEFSK